jgi:hypothetical protein
LSLRKILALHEHLLDDLIFVSIVGVLHDLDDFVSGVLGFTHLYCLFFVGGLASLRSAGSRDIGGFLRAVMAEMSLLFTCKAFPSLHEFLPFVCGDLPSSNTVG